MDVWEILSKSENIEFPRLSTLVESLGNHFFEGSQK
jgi:hypothetical protein